LKPSSKHISILTATSQTGASTGSTFSDMSRYQHFVVTNNFTTGTGTFGVAIDTKIGDTWINVARGSDLTTAGKQVISLVSRANSAANEATAAQTQAGEGTIKAIPVHDQIRARIVHTTATLVTGTVTLYAVE
jgi:hypothetical protein